MVDVAAHGLHKRPADRHNHALLCVHNVGSAHYRHPVFYGGLVGLLARPQTPLVSEHD